MPRLTDLHATHSAKFQEIVVFLARQINREVASLSPVERARIEAKAARLTANWNEVKHVSDSANPSCSKGELLRLLKEHWEISTEIVDVRRAALARARAT